MAIRENGLSYWEEQTWFTNVDYTVIGSGIVGLNAALTLAQKFPQAKILVLEKGFLPQGASTKNAGFSCFGSISEILADLKSHSEAEVLQLVEKRWKGLELLQKNLGADSIDFQQNGSYELFHENGELFKECKEQLSYVNKLLEPIFKDAVFSPVDNKFSFKSIHSQYIFNKFEGQIDTGKMMQTLLQKVRNLGVTILNTLEVKNIEDNASSVSLELSNGIQFSSKKVLIATNGFASQLLDENVKPARAQVLITKPIENLHIKGTFHLDEGYYYFRNIHNRVLFGGGRNLDFNAEETTAMNTTSLIQNKLEELLKTTILPDTPFEIEHRWAGIMGVGQQKKAIVKPISDNVFCGVRMGGMGVAIGSLVGKELAELVF